MDNIVLSNDPIPDDPIPDVPIPDDPIPDDPIPESSPENNGNPGSGSGGAQTNINGLNYEDQKNLESEFNNISKKNGHTVITFKGYPDTEFITGTKNEFMKYLKNEELEEYKNNNNLRLHGTKEPDKWFIKGDNMFIIEIKFQSRGGSVSEKLQTAYIKLREFKKRYPNKKIFYIYGLSQWFKQNCQGEIRNLREDNIPYFWGDDSNFKINIIKYMIDN